MTNAHQQAYGQGNAGGLDSSSMGAAAAMQVRSLLFVVAYTPLLLTALRQIMKKFTSGGGDSGGGGNMQTQLISMAMSEASNLYVASLCSAS